MENENLPMNNGGDQDGVDETTHFEDNSEYEEGVDETTPDSTEPTAKLDEERRRAITASIQKSKEAEQARKEAEYLKLENKVLRDPTTILDLDEGIAERIAQDTFGKSLQEVKQILAQQNASSTPSSQPDDFRKVYREERERERMQEEQKKIDRLEVDFFVQRNIDPKNPVFKQVMSTYQKFKPSSYEEAQELLEMALLRTQKTGTKGQDSTSIPSYRSSTSVPAKKTQSKMTPNQLALAKKLGLTEDYLK